MKGETIRSGPEPLGPIVARIVERLRDAQTRKRAPLVSVLGEFTDESKLVRMAVETDHEAVAPLIFDLWEGHSAALPNAAAFVIELQPLLIFGLTDFPRWQVEPDWLHDRPVRDGVKITLAETFNGCDRNMIARIVGIARITPCGLAARNAVGKLGRCKAHFKAPAQDMRSIRYALLGDAVHSGYPRHSSTPPTRNEAASDHAGRNGKDDPETEELNRHGLGLRGAGESGEHYPAPVRDVGIVDRNAAVRHAFVPEPVPSHSTLARLPASNHDTLKVGRAFDRKPPALLLWPGHADSPSGRRSSQTLACENPSPTASPHSLSEEPWRRITTIRRSFVAAMGGRRPLSGSKPADLSDNHRSYSSIGGGALLWIVA